MSRRPRRNRPPRLDDLPVPRAGRADQAPERGGVDARRALVAARVTGPHQRLGRAAVGHAVRAVALGEPRALLGCDDLAGAGVDEVRAALVESHGFDPEAARAAIDPDATLGALRVAAERLRDAAAAGARIAVATGRPASLLALGQWVAGETAEQGAHVLAEERASVDGPGRRQLWWVGDVAVVTDGSALLADDGVRAADDWLFALGRPDLVVADRGFAGGALRAGVEVIAWADLDAPALALAAARGRPILVVPLDEQRPPGAYDAVIRVLAAPPSAAEPAGSPAPG